MNLGITTWIIVLIFTYPLFCGLCRWIPTYYHAPSYELIEIKIDSVRWVGKTSKSPTGFSQTYPDKIIYMTKKNYLRPFKNKTDPSFGKDPDYHKSFSHWVWHSEKTKYMYGYNYKDDHFPKEQFLRYSILAIIPLVLFYGWVLISLIQKTRNKFKS